MQLQAYVPLVTHPEAPLPECASNIAALAADLKASLNVTAINVNIPDISNALSRLLLDTPELIRRAETGSRRKGEDLLDAFRAACGSRSVPVDTSMVAAPLPTLTDRAAAEARYFDLSIVGVEPRNDTSRLVAEAVMFGSGRPTILLPAKFERRALRNVVIAWDGSRVSARAVGDALGLLPPEVAIAVLTVIDEKPLDHLDAAERLAALLRKRGTPAQAESIEAGDCQIAVTLQERAMELEADLLVMGAFGHSRLRDFILGGATAGVLDNLRLPALLSH